MKQSFFSAIHDTEVEDILMHSQALYCYSKGAWNQKHNSEFISSENSELLSQVASFIGEQVGQSLSLVNPSIDSFIELESHFFRAHLIGPPLSPDGIQMTLRRVPKEVPPIESSFLASHQQLETLKLHIQSKSNILICGPTGVGKTSFLRGLLNKIPTNERLILLEDSPEIPLNHLLHTRLLSRENRFGFQSGAHWDLSRLVFESLRMRPDRIWVGECRGPEAMAIAQAISTGHRGLLTTIHADNVTAAIHRFEALCQNSPFKSKNQWDLVVSLKCQQNHQRIIGEVYETNS